MLLFSASTCVRSHSTNIKKIAAYNLTMPEPSGLAMDPDMKHLWIVSDRKGQIYKTDLRGVVQEKIDIKASDFEGVAISREGETLYVIDEAKNRIQCYQHNGKSTCKHGLNQKVTKKSGPEGIDVDWENGDLYVVNESNPTQIYHLNKEFVEIERHQTTVLSDLSAICVDPKSKDIWLLSDEDQKLIRVSSDYEIKNEYLIDIKQMEGLAIDYARKIIYIVSDAEEELHVFKY